MISWLSRSLVVVLLVLAACQASDALPDEYLGRWFYTGTSGGLAGDTFGQRDGSFIIITADNTIERYDVDGVMVRADDFDARRGETIFGPEAWILEGTEMIPVVATADGTVLTLSDNVYDGFSVGYERE